MSFDRQGGFSGPRKCVDCVRVHDVYVWDDLSAVWLLCVRFAPCNKATHFSIYVVTRERGLYVNVSVCVCVCEKARARWSPLNGHKYVGAIGYYLQAAAVRGVAWHSLALTTLTLTAWYCLRRSKRVCVWMCFRMDMGSYVVCHFVYVFKLIRLHIKLSFQGSASEFDLWPCPVGIIRLATIYSVDIW